MSGKQLLITSDGQHHAYGQAEVDVLVALAEHWFHGIAMDDTRFRNHPASNHNGGAIDPIDASAAEHARHGGCFIGCEHDPDAGHEGEGNDRPFARNH
jgi:hypothetical protein